MAINLSGNDWRGINNLVAKYITRRTIERTKTIGKDYSRSPTVPRFSRRPSSRNPEASRGIRDFPSSLKRPIAFVILPLFCYYCRVLSGAIRTVLAARHHNRTPGMAI